MIFLSEVVLGDRKAKIYETQLGYVVEYSENNKLIQAQGVATLRLAEDMAETWVSAKQLLNG